MTLIAAFRCPDGAVISADSQETITVGKDQYRCSVQKIKPEKIGDFDFLMAGSGNGVLIDAFIQRFSDALKKSKIVGLEEFKSLFQSELLQFTKDEAVLVRNRDMTLIVAARSQEEKEYQVWRTAATRLRVVDTYQLVGFTEHLYRHSAEQLYSPTIPVSQAALLSLRLLDLARRTSNCVDRPYDLVVIGKTGLWEMDERLVKQFSESLELFGAALNKLLLACPDTSLSGEKFGIVLKEFSDTALHLRKEYLIAIAEVVFSRTRDGKWHGDPFPLVPAGTFLGKRLDGTIAVIEGREGIKAMVEMIEQSRKARKGNSSPAVPEPGKQSEKE